MGASDLQTEHLIGAPVVTLDGSKAIVETNAVIVGENVKLQLGCSVHNRFYDLAEGHDGVWKLIKRQSVYDMGTLMSDAVGLGAASSCTGTNAALT